MNSWIKELFEESSLLRMGHGQRAEDLNLGLGWLYYAMGRVVKPRSAVVIGSHRGFVPIVMAKALQDNLEPGTLTFIDPSLVDSFWREPDDVQQYFRGHGVSCFCGERTRLLGVVPWRFPTACWGFVPR